MTGELKRQNYKWNQAWLTKDVAVVETIASKDYMYIGPQGLSTRKTSLKADSGVAVQHHSGVSARTGLFLLADTFFVEGQLALQSDQFTSQ